MAGASTPVPSGTSHLHGIEGADVAERERLTNKERRAQAREERKRKEAEEAAKRKKGQMRNGLITSVVVVVIAAVLLQAFLGGPDTIEDQITIAAGEVDAARTAAGCEVLVERDDLDDRSHFEPASIPPADAIYTGIRPTHSGPHATTVVGVTTYNRQMDEVVSTHNLEHGAIAVWWDPDEADGGEIASWAQTLNASGFEQGGGAGILTSPYDDPGIPGDATVAFRAWGTAMDCEQWDETVANAFVADHYGTRGIGPERTIAPYPEEVLDFTGRDVDDTTDDEAPVDGEPMEDVEEADPDEAEADTDGDDADDGDGEDD